MTWLQAVLTLPSLYQQVLSYHPLARSIALGPAIAQAEAQAAAGIWDPTLSINITEKRFKNQLYYNLLAGELKVPVWNGIDFKGLYEQTGGFTLNPEDITPSSGLVGFGFSVPLLGEGLLLDYRRAVIQKVRIYARVAEQEQRLAWAGLLLEIAQDYWAWFAAYHKARLYEEQVRIAKARLIFLRQALAQGEATRADTLEALVEFQLRQQQLTQSRAELLQKALAVQRHIWQEPVPSPQTFVVEYRPDSTIPYVPRGVWDSLIVRHPKIQMYALKRQVADLERRRALEQLRPRLQAEYLWLQQGLKWHNPLSRDWRSDYKFGITFAMPLYLRQARGNLLAARLEIRQIEMEQAYEARTLYNKAMGQIGLLDSLWGQVNLQRQLSEHLAQLVQLELIRYRNGESDLFVVNRREREAFSALLQVYELYARYGVEVAQLRALLVWNE
ncbi:MAG: TolC family protein [Bacteroidia bacterium]|nr:TolC family protein [Bacteroidia bacterium]MDW8235869.1 TolC family protein [Bacteroidia bacterium]